MELSKRLLCVASMVSHCDTMADIGTDHGYVPIYLVQKNVCAHALAMDINPGPLERADRHIRSYGLSAHIKTRLSNGLEKLLPGEVSSVVIAGMGGALIEKILEAGHHVLHPEGSFGPELILSPQSEWFKVRKCLHREAYRIIEEDFLFEDGKYYLVIKAVPGKDQKYTEAEYMYSRLLLQSENPLFISYLTNELKKKQQIADKLDSSTSDNQAQRINLLQEEIKMINSLISGVEKK